LTEAGDYSEKYYAAKDLIAKYNLNVPNVAMPTMPAETTKTAYPTISATQHLTLNDLVQQVVSMILKKKLYKEKFHNILLACQHRNSIAERRCHGGLADK
jgi:hypothetical protein